LRENNTRIININVFWYVTPRNLVDGYQSLEDISAKLFGTGKKDPYLRRQQYVLILMPYFVQIRRSYVS